MKRLGSVLLAEDDPLVRAVLEPLLAEFAQELVSVSTGTLAMEALLLGSFDVLVTDFQMPGASGLEVMRAARARFPAMRLVMVSGYADESVQSEVEACGGTLLHKPFGIADLRRALWGL